MDQFFANLDMEKMMQAMMPMLQSFQNLQTSMPRMVAESVASGTDPKTAPEVTNFLDCMDQTVADPILKKVTDEFGEAAQRSGLMDSVTEMSSEFGKFGESLKVTVVENLMDPLTKYCEEKNVLPETLMDISDQIATATQNDEPL